MSHPTRILLTGSHGFVGTQLAQGGATVFGLDRVAPMGHQILNCDLRTPNLEQHLPEAIDVMIHSAAALPSHGRDEIFQTDVLATLHLLLRTRRKNVRQFIHVSSTAVYGPKHPPNVSEATPSKAWDAYNRAQIRAEALVPQAFEGSDTQWTILRPKAIVGPGRMGLFGQLFDFAASGKRFPVIGDGASTYQFLHVDDLVTAVLKMIEMSAAAHGHIRNIASRADHSIAAFSQSVLDAAGHGKRLLHVPVWLACAVLGTSHALDLSPIYSRLVHNLTLGSTVSLDAAHRVLGYTPEHSGLSALQDAFAWYQRRATDVAGTTGHGHREIWKSQLVNIVKSII